MIEGGKYLVLLLAVMALLLWTQTSSHATPTLRLTDGTTTVTIVDGQTGDLNPDPGWVTFLGGIVGSWNQNVSTGQVGENMAAPYMDLNSVNKTKSANPPILTIQFSEVDFTGGISSGFYNAMLSVGGTTQGSATFKYWLDDDNKLFGLTTLLGTLGPYEPGAFSGSIQARAEASAPFSLTVEAILKHPTGVDAELSTSFNLEATQAKVPEPLTLILYGLGFAGAGLYRRMRRPQ